MSFNEDKFRVNGAFFGFIISFFYYKPIIAGGFVFLFFSIFEELGNLIRGDKLFVDFPNYALIVLILPVTISMQYLKNNKKGFYSYNFEVDKNKIVKQDGSYNFYYTRGFEKIKQNLIDALNRKFPISQKIKSKDAMLITHTPNQDIRISEDGISVNVLAIKEINIREIMINSGVYDLELKWSDIEEIRLAMQEYTSTMSLNGLIKLKIKSDNDNRLFTGEKLTISIMRYLFVNQQELMLEAFKKYAKCKVIHNDIAFFIKIESGQNIGLGFKN
jgi:hypothetical protein